jgi:voltage-gated potassium channel
VATVKPVSIIFAVLFVLASGTIGYMIFEGWDWLDSLYMTVITVTTVGFQEVHRMSAEGRIFTIILIFVGMGIAVVAISGLATMLLKGELQSLLGRRRMQTEMKNLSNHVILAGYGRMGQIIADLLRQKKRKFVIIDKFEDAIEAIAEIKEPVVVGNVSDEAVLREARIDKAAAFICVVSSDADNAFAIMTAKGVNKSIHVVTRAVDSRSIPKLKLAGADRVIAPYHIGGTRIAQAVLNPAVADFVEFVEDPIFSDIEMADVLIAEGSQLDGVLLSAEVIRETGIIVVGIKRAAGDFMFKPQANTKLHGLDQLVVVGPTEGVKSLFEASGC